MNVNVQYLNIMKNNLDHFEVLRKIQSKPNSSQKRISYRAWFSLGKLNYCLKALKEKGLIKIKNLKKKPNKVGVRIHAYS